MVETGNIPYLHSNDVKKSTTQWSSFAGIYFPLRCQLLINNMFSLYTISFTCLMRNKFILVIRIFIKCRKTSKTLQLQL